MIRWTRWHTQRNNNTTSTTQPRSSSLTSTSYANPEKGRATRCLKIRVMEDGPLPTTRLCSQDNRSALNFPCERKGGLLEQDVWLVLNVNKNPTLVNLGVTTESYSKCKGVANHWGVLNEKLIECLDNADCSLHHHTNHHTTESWAMSCYTAY